MAVKRAHKVHRVDRATQASNIDDIHFYGDFSMLVQVHTDPHIQGGASLQDWVKTEVGGSLERFQPQLTRVEVFLSDLNSHKPAAK